LHISRGLSTNIWIAIIIRDPIQGAFCKFPRRRHGSPGELAAAPELWGSPLNLPPTTSRSPPPASLAKPLPPVSRAGYSGRPPPCSLPRSGRRRERKARSPELVRLAPLVVAPPRIPTVLSMTSRYLSIVQSPNPTTHGACCHL
jgi:hypothetical protein